MIVLVTGATSGFGKAIAERFIKDGSKVIGVGRRRDRLNELHKQLGPNFYGLTLDIQKKDKIAVALADLPESFRDIDVLVNNAGLALGLEPAQKGNLEDWDEMIKTNINGLLYCTRAILPGMIERGRGHIINMGSVAGEFPYPGGNVYGGTGRH